MRGSAGTSLFKSICLFLGGGLVLWFLGGAWAKEQSPPPSSPAPSESRTKSVPLPAMTPVPQQKGLVPEKEDMLLEEKKQEETLELRKPGGKVGGQEIRHKEESKE